MASFTILFNALVKNNHHETVISRFKRFNSTGLLPNLILFNVLLNCVCNRGRACDGFVVLGRILRLGFSPDAVTLTSLIKCLCREGRIMKATQLFKNMNPFRCRPNVITYGTLIQELCQTGNTNVALKLHELMVKGNSENGVMGTYCKKQNINEAMSLYREMISKGVVPNNITYRFIDGLCKNGCVVEAMELLDILKKDKFILSIKSYNGVIDGLCKTRRLKIAHKLFHELPQEGLEPNIVIYNIMVQRLCKKGKLEEANDLLSIMEEEGCALDLITYKL
ncbi:hypothetical protein EZV62_009186 [Acer yangbiense]|uniref:Pentacotripeptide-repeat region of PRORP domain-containing protein n=1 Tax=Acer yangbiense TaxID=1000413 RepID=A0A5C7IFK9_9ROSI|nr:hypothetical protein EZV62_009003 [Acer yangbiense]TXG67911.1 hypothetical protein EZV62_009186 [Acer yangbiense]